MQLKHALEQKEQIQKALQGKSLVFFSDYDGTLTPIVDKPELAVLSDAMRDCLQKLSQLYPVAIISGRALSDVKQLVAIDGLYYAGNHGLEVVGPDINEHFEIDSSVKSLVRTIEQFLLKRVNRVPGILIENKEISLTMHYRLAAEDRVAELEKVVDEVVLKNPTLVKKHGKKVFEIRPKVNWDKGRVVNYLLERLDLLSDEVVPVYLGDDVTDEDAFAVLQEKGLSILVSEIERPSLAQFYLRSTDEVFEFLNIYADD